MPQDDPSRRHNRAPVQTIDSLRIPEALLKIHVVSAVTGLSASSIYRKVSEGKFPAPVKDGSRCTRWVAGQVSNWLRAKGTS